MEERTPVRMIQVDYKCPECKTGYLRHTGMVLTSDPPQFPHKCNNPNCHYRETFMNKSYPYIDYEPIKTE